MPRNSHYWQAVLNDPDHAEQIARANDAAKARGDATDAGPPMSSWSAEVDRLTTLIDRIGVLTFYAMQQAGHKSPPKPEPLPRPTTLLPKFQRAARQERHEELRARLLGR